MQDGVGNHALFHNHHNATGQPDDERHTQQIAGTVNKTAGQLFLTQPGDDADHDGRTKEERAHSGHPPALGGNTPYHHDERQCENDQGNFLGAGEFEIFQLIVALKEQLAVSISLFSDHGAGWIGFDPPCIAHNVRRTNDEATYKQHKPKHNAVRKGNIGSVGGNDCCKGVDR